MWIFLTVFVLAAFIYTILNLSLADSGKVFWAGIIVLACFSFIIYPVCIRQTNQTLNQILQHSDLVSAIALLQIFESIAILFFSISQITGHYFQHIRRLFKWLSAIPSLIFLMGLFFLQTYTFLHTEDISFTMIATLFTLFVGVSVLLLTWLVKKVIQEWEIRAELKLLIALFQILLAMFLPLIIQGAKVPFTNLVVEPFPILITAVTVLVFSLIGFFRYHLTNNKIKT